MSASKFMRMLSRSSRRFFRFFSCVAMSLAERARSTDEVFGQRLGRRVLVDRRVARRLLLDLGALGAQVRERLLLDRELRIDELEAVVAQHLDLPHRLVGLEQHAVADLALLLVARGLFLGGLRLGFLGGDDAFLAPDRHALAIQHVAVLVGVLRRHAVAVVDLAVLVDPAIELLPGRRRGACLQREQREQQRREEES